MKCELVTLTENTVIKVARNTQFVLAFDIFDGRKLSIDLQFETPNVSAEIIGLYFLKEGQSLDLTTITTHKSPNTSCFTNIRGVLGNGTKSNYVGKIIIEKSAQQTSSFLHDSVLVVGENTQNSSEPILEIEADDVKASHGATTGRINPDHVYYLQSRGLTINEAQDQIVQGFFEEMLSKITSEKVREKVKKEIYA